MTIQPSKQKILIVDDVVHNIAVLRDILHSDYQIFMATNGRDALSRAHSEKPDIILLDIVMPEMDGFKICEYLKEDEQTSDIPVIFITGNNEIENETRGLSLGAVDFISKPINALVVQARIKTHLEMKRQKDVLRVLFLEKEQAAEIVRKHRDQLEIRVEERTTELNQLLKTLQDTLVMAESANRAKSEFLSTISHEIRTPMNAVIGFIELSMRDQLSPTIRSNLVKANDASHSLMEIINDILDISTADVGKVELDFVEFDLHVLFEKLEHRFSQQAADKELELTFSVASGLDYVLFGDVKRLEQVLINLIRNALKFTETGTIVVKVEWGQSVAFGPIQLLFSVKDTGIGIDPKQLPKLFDPFIQADTSTTRRFSGTGLGLTISKRLVELMNGQIWAESMPGKGTVFLFSLKLDCRSADMDRFPRFPKQINQKKGLEQVSGNQKLYRRLLVRFRKDHANMANKIDGALKKGDIETVMRMIHTVKGVSGNIGLLPLHQAAKALEKAVKDGDKSQWESLREKFNEALNLTLSGLDRLKEVDTPLIPSLTLEKIPIDTDPIIPLLTDLAVHLEGYSVETHLLMETLKNQLETTHAAPALWEMEKHMNSYDFELARKALDKLADVLEISLNP